MTQSEQPETPSQILAKRIVERLIQEQLVTRRAAEQLQPKLSQGRVSAEDWRLAVELGIEGEQTA